MVGNSRVIHVDTVLHVITWFTCEFSLCRSHGMVDVELSRLKRNSQLKFCSATILTSFEMRDGSDSMLWFMYIVSGSVFFLFLTRTLFAFDHIVAFRIRCWEKCSLK